VAVGRDHPVGDDVGTVADVIGQLGRDHRVLDGDLALVDAALLAVVDPDASGGHRDRLAELEGDAVGRPVQPGLVHRFGGEEHGVGGGRRRQPYADYEPNDEPHHGPRQ
jgi:hypothetical protein